jgi:ABC-type dipeptide/oligopeptide/nickel transport system ATPase component
MRSRRGHTPAHELPAVRHFTDRVAVMFQGQILEQGPPK